MLVRDDTPRSDLPLDQPCILVTGSRRWGVLGRRPTPQEKATAARLLDQMANRLDAAAAGLRPQRDGRITLMHGDCEGADRAARDHALTRGWTVRARPAIWAADCRPQCAHGPRARRRDGSTYCQAAGPYRNAEMIDEVKHLFLPVLVVAFFLPSSRGTDSLVKIARENAVFVEPVRGAV